MAEQRIGSAKKNLTYYNILILQKSKNQTVKDQSTSAIQDSSGRTAKSMPDSNA